MPERAAEPLFSTDIVERLTAAQHRLIGDDSRLCGEAADEIERLHAVVALGDVAPGLVAALRRMTYEYGLAGVHQTLDLIRASGDY